MTPWEIEPATFRLVAQFLNQLLPENTTGKMVKMVINVYNGLKIVTNG